MRALSSSSCCYWWWWQWPCYLVAPLGRLWALSHSVLRSSSPTPASFFKTNSYFCCCDSFFCISPLCSVYLCKLTAVRQIEINTFSYSVGRLGCFQFLVFVNNAAQNTFVQQSLSWVGLFPGAGILNVELQGQRAYAFLCL